MNFSQSKIGTDCFISNGGCLTINLATPILVVLHYLYIFLCFD